MTDMFTADLHINHQRILTLGRTRFATLADMHELIITNWNAKVGDKDVVYVLGDMALGPIELLNPIVERLRGEIVLVKGNHDKSSKRLQQACPKLRIVLDDLHMKQYIGDKGYRVFCRHFPPSEPDPKVWEEKYRCSTFLCGHVHSSWSRRGNIINVGVDVRDYTPQTFEELFRSPTTPEKPRQDQCKVCGKSLTDVADDATRTFRQCPKHPEPELQ